MKTIGKITIRTKEDFSSPKSYNSYKRVVRSLSKPLILSVVLFILGLFICYLNAMNAAFAFTILHETFDGIISLAMALAMSYYAIYVYREAKQSVNIFSSYERLVYDIIHDIETDTQLEIPFEEFK